MLVKKIKYRREFPWGIQSKKANPLYRIWNGMKKRCYCQSEPAYKNYGARGIIICERWRSDFSAFFSDVEADFEIGLTIERVNNNGNYEPNNIKWITRGEQNRNKRNNILIEYKGETKCLVEFADDYNIKRTTLIGRIKKGWDIEKALTGPVRVWNR
jgi:hypothetical protein